jgi:hypothetical protein
MSNQGWWTARTQEQADESVQEICDKTRRIAIPWFESTSTPVGLAQELVIWATRLRDVQTLFDLACCYVTAGDLTAAIKSLQEAIGMSYGRGDAFCFFEEYVRYRESALKKRALAEELVAAIANGTHENLLSRWRNQNLADFFTREAAQVEAARRALEFVSGLPSCTALRLRSMHPDTTVPQSGASKHPVAWIVVFSLDLPDGAAMDGQVVVAVNLDSGAVTIRE